MSYIKQAEQNAMDREELAQYRAQNEANKLSSAIEEGRSIGKEEGINVGIEIALANSPNFRNTIVEGSPQDLQYQADTQRGINYQEPIDNGPSFVDNVSGVLSKAANGISDWFNNATKEDPYVDPHADLKSSAEQDFIDFESQSAGEAELAEMQKKAAVKDIDSILSNQRN